MTNSNYFVYIGIGLVATFMEYREAKSKTYQDALVGKKTFDRTFKVNLNREQVLKLIEEKTANTKFINSYKDDIEFVMVLEEVTTWKNYGWFYIIRIRVINPTSSEILISSMYKADRYVFDFFHNRKLNKLLLQLGVM